MRRSSAPLGAQHAAGPVGGAAEHAAVEAAPPAAASSRRCTSAMGASDGRDAVRRREDAVLARFHLAMLRAARQDIDDAQDLEDAGASRRGPSWRGPGPRRRRPATARPLVPTAAPIYAVVGLAHAVGDVASPCRDELHEMLARPNTRCHAKSPHTSGCVLCAEARSLRSQRRGSIRARHDQSQSRRGRTRAPHAAPQKVPAGVPVSGRRAAAGEGPGGAPVTPTPAAGGCSPGRAAG
eukprot:CAMPEP_0179267768 /NCGR_PEP_ID=MMETSP0797-20121207/30094_1 /TAXON_ID=47934 /ORGANISM="Dinophysis acuminata, Strain DAEP01" /LENGTH=237 /DNA_ID=CAMNT_0020976027 /DNA_START=36 /DNA_END=745 /DNA_ORIENTATION=-